MIEPKVKHSQQYFRMNVSTKQSIDTGMVLVLVTLIISYFTKSDRFIVLSIFLLILNILFPNTYRPLAKVWFGISNILGRVVSRLLLTLIFFLIVTPIGIFRKMIRAESLQLKEWKKNTSSVFEVRNHLFQPEEIEKPY